MLLAAGYVHDVGYAPGLAKAGFHLLDGARFVRGGDPGGQGAAGAFLFVAPSDVCGL